MLTHFASLHDRSIDHLCRLAGQADTEQDVQGVSNPRQQCVSLVVTQPLVWRYGTVSIFKSINHVLILSHD